MNGYKKDGSALDAARGIRKRRLDEYKVESRAIQPRTDSAWKNGYHQDGSALDAARGMRKRRLDEYKVESEGHPVPAEEDEDDVIVDADSIKDILVAAFEGYGEPTVIEKMHLWEESDPEKWDELLGRTMGFILDEIQEQIGYRLSYAEFLAEQLIHIFQKVDQAN